MSLFLPGKDNRQGASFLLVLRHILARRHAIHLLEHCGERGGVAESAGIHDGGDVAVLLRQQVCSLLQAYVADELLRALACLLLHLPIKMHTAETYLGGKTFHTHAVVCQVGVDDFDHSFHELLIGRQHLHVVNLLLADVCIEFRLQHLPRVEEIDDSVPEHIKIERLVR